MSTIEPADIADLIEKLGGVSAAARFFGEEPQTVWNWRERKSLPTKLFFQHEALLTDRDFKCPKSFWGFAEPVTSDSEAA